MHHLNLISLHYILKKMKSDIIPHVALQLVYNTGNIFMTNFFINLLAIKKHYLRYIPHTYCLLGDNYGCTNRIPNS